MKYCSSFYQFFKNIRLDISCELSAVLADDSHALLALFKIRRHFLCYSLIKPVWGICIAPVHQHSEAVILKVSITLFSMIDKTKKKKKKNNNNKKKTHEYSFFLPFFVQWEIRKDTQYSSFFPFLFLLFNNKYTIIPIFFLPVFYLSFCYQNILLTLAVCNFITGSESL